MQPESFRQNYSNTKVKQLDINDTTSKYFDFKKYLNKFIEALIVHIFTEFSLIMFTVFVKPCSHLPLKSTIF